MRFSFAVLPLLTTASSAFVISAFNTANCQGAAASQITVQDNSCSKSINLVSFKVDQFGGQGQMARFFHQTNCTGIAQPYVADRQEGPWFVGSCWDFSGGDPIVSASSESS